MTRERLQELTNKFIAGLDDSCKEEWWGTNSDSASTVMEWFDTFLDDELCEYQIQGYFYNVGGAEWKVLEIVPDYATAEFTLQSYDESDETTRHRIVKVDKELE